MDYSKIDWKLLRKQKETIQDSLANTKVWTKDEEAMEGIINLLDYLQDEAAKVLGEEEVFGK